MVFIDWEKNSFVVINLLTSLVFMVQSALVGESEESGGILLFRKIRLEKCYVNRKLEGRFFWTVCVLLLLFSLAFFQSLLAPEQTYLITGV